jgi:hypothetical protein
MYNFSQKYEGEMRADWRVILKSVLQKDIVTVDWIHVMNSSVQWCHLVKMAMNV